MATSSRTVVPEMLDELEPDDPRALRSRLDLQRVHRAMRSVSILKRALMSAAITGPPRRILELGAGDATLVLKLGQKLQPQWSGVHLTVLDRYDLVSAPTRKAYQELGWQLTVIRRDALKWASESGSQHFDLCITTLFLHHFEAESLSTLMHAIAARCDAFIACEPRRSGFARLGGAFIGLLGTNQVTQSDAVKSVQAGFVDQELTALWPDAPAHWSCREYPAFPFSHCFVAVRVEPKDRGRGHEN